MDILEKQALIAEIERFKEEAMKSYVVSCWAESYTNTDPFGYVVLENENSKVWWLKTQAYQLWEMWQAAKAQAVPEPVLNAPACVGAGTFQKGVKWSTVISAAQRHYENDGHHERPAISIADQLRIASGHSVVVSKERLTKAVNGIEELFKEDSTLALGELLPIQQDLNAMIEAQEQKVTNMKIAWGMECPKCNHNEATIHSTAEKDSGYEFMHGDSVVCLNCGNTGEMDANGEDSDIVWNEDESQEPTND